MRKYIVLIGSWLGRLEADTDAKASIKGIALYKKETGSLLKTVELLPYTFPRRLKDRDTSILQVLEERARRGAKL